MNGDTFGLLFFPDIHKKYIEKKKLGVKCHLDLKVSSSPFFKSFLKYTSNEMKTNISSSIQE